MCQILLWQNIGNSVLSRANFQSTSPLKVTVVRLKCTQFRLSNLTPWVCFLPTLFPHTIHFEIYFATHLNISKA